MNNALNQATALTPDSSIYIAGHRGMVGSAIKRQLEQKGFSNILCKTHNELDLCNQAQVNAFFSENQIDYVVLAAAKVGGIHANNTYPAEFIYQNLMMEANIIHGAWQAGINRLLFLGSSCIYPKMALQPMSEDELLTGTLEPTNEPYAIAKIAGIKLCESYNRQYGTHFRSVMPTNLYGPNDNFHPENSHVIPALMRRIHEAKVDDLDEVVIWGTGNARREFLHVDDMASACLHVMELTDLTYETHTEPMLSHINVGTGIDISIRELAETIQNEIGFEGRLVFDTSKPDGTPRKLLDVSRLDQLGWSAGINIEDGLRNTYNWYIDNLDNIRY
jgi:GDP-L-fucose synthase